MAKKRCLIHANCQGPPLTDLLRAHPEFGRDFEIAVYTNYTREHVPEQALASCALFLHQWLGPDWGDVSSDALSAKLPRDCRTVCIPNLMFLGYWPFWSSARGFNYSDMYLDALLARGLNRKEIIHVYLYTDPGRCFDLDARFAEWLDREREKEQRWDIRMVDEVLSRYQKELLFNTINHPNRRLCLRTADELLRLLGFSPLPAEVKNAFAEPFDEFVLPIHPAVAAHHGLEFLETDAVFPVYGAAMDLAEYVSCYVECKLAGETDFISFLRLRAVLAHGAQVPE